MTQIILLSIQRRLINHYLLTKQGITVHILLRNNLFYKFQSGFLPNNSTVYQLLEIYHSICMDLEDKRNTGFIFCDVSKAFDRVWHKGLILKLKSHGIKGSLLDTFEKLS